MNLSDHFTLEEMTFSDTAARHGIANDPTPEALENLKITAAKMEEIRALLGFNPIIVHSGYRSPAVNQVVGGVPTSAHCKGLACDFVCPGFGSNFSVAQAIERSKMAYDQLILEYGWVHIGLRENGEAWRRQALTKRSASAPYEGGLNA